MTVPDDMNCRLRCPVKQPGMRAFAGMLLLLLLSLATACAPRVATVTPDAAVLAGINVDRLNDRQLALAQQITAKLGPYIEERRRQGTQVTLSYDELYQPLDVEESAFLKNLQTIRPENIGVKTPYLGFGSQDVKLVRLDQSYVDTKGVTVIIPPQYLPEQVNLHYETMMASMQKEIGKRLYVVSGYRSGAYQLYLFVRSLSNHDWSVRETARFVAFPGYSEHGDTSRQALDFANTDNISEEAGMFEKLPEYQWLMERAACFGFALSYPPNSPTGITFEPWHWHAESNLPCRRNN